ncbi:MAG: hypothetical protein LBQ88_04900 [Treponema sp.]|nr:hypothetical protein [Treponema sp.]
MNTKVTDGKQPLFSAKDITYIAAWIGGLVLAGALLWLLTQTPRDKALLNAVNRILEQREAEPRLESLIPFNSLSPRQKRLGTWFSIFNSDKRGLVFTIMNGGILFPYMAVVTPEGFVERLVFLNPQTLQGTVPDGIVNQYILRIERNAKQRRAGNASGEREL